jgi:hypothetical protein
MDITIIRRMHVPLTAITDRTILKVVFSSVLDHGSTGFTAAEGIMAAVDSTVIVAGVERVSAAKAVSFTAEAVSGAATSMAVKVSTAAASGVAKASMEGVTASTVAMVVAFMAVEAPTAAATVVVDRMEAVTGN